MNTVRSFIVILLSLLLLLSCAPVENAEIPQDKPETEKPEEDKPEEEESGEIVEPGWETAAEAAANMRLGWNLGNTLDCHHEDGGRGNDWLYWETFWGQSKTTPELMKMMKKAGFGAIRVPVTWGLHMDASGKVYDSWMNRVREIVDYVLDTGMYCIINIHHDTGAADDVWLLAGMDVYEKEREKYSYLWEQIAEEFKDYGPRLLFESYNEMLDTRRSWCYASFNGGYDAAFAADAYEAINAYAQTFVDVVRSTGGNNTARNLIVNTYGACSGAGTWNQHLKDPLKEMKLPEDVVEDHIIFEVHAYPNIDNMDSMRAEVDDMFNAINEHLASKGAPVIFGEWGTSSESPSIEDKCDFLRHFVKKAIEYNFCTFYWMGLSDGTARSLPAFNEPEFAETILKGYYGDAYEPELPTIDDYDIIYTIDYSDLWGEASISSKKINMTDYYAVYLLLDKAPASGKLSLKVYGEGDKVQYSSISNAEVTIPFDKSAVGKTASRITIQNMQNSKEQIVVKKAALVRMDGTKETCNVSKFWGCTVTLSGSIRQ